MYKFFENVLENAGCVIIVNIRDIAKAAGVSVSTVSKALNGYSDVKSKTREMILDVAKEMDYLPNVMARGLITKKSNTIGIFFGDRQNSGFDNPFFSELIRSIKDVAGAEGYDILIFANQKRNTSSYKTICYEKGVDGVILILTGDQRTDENIRELHESLPTVYIDSVSYQYTNVNFVETENVNASFQAVEHLIQLGHTRILKMAGDQVAKASYDRIEGYKQALNKYGHKVDSDLILYGEFSRDKAYQLTKRFFSKDSGVTAVFASSDMMAFGIIDALKDLGFKVPEDIAVIGFDDIDESKDYQPPLTTVHQQRFTMGETAAKMLLQLIDSQDGITRHATIPARFVIRESSGTKREG
ncbi:LacI family DNA-binding transcriptional regulator [Paenibacillus apii]|nr:LacI family DNA-binding transcriptional regulator [Paenibacillus apii]